VVTEAGLREDGHIFSAS
jgi:hypothetical protein